MTPDQLDKWSKKRAEEHGALYDDDPQLRGCRDVAVASFLAGMATAQGVHDLVGYLKCHHDMLFKEADEVAKKAISAFDKLKVLLGAEEK